MLDSRLKGALLPLLLGTPHFCSWLNLWDAALSVRQGCGGREAYEVPSTVTLWMRAAAQCDPTNQHKSQLGGCHRQRAKEKQRSCMCLSLAGKGQWCLLLVLPAPPDALSLPVPPVSVLCVVPW